MKIKLNDLRAVKVAAGNPVGLAPGWYAVHEAGSMCFGPFSTLGEWSDWVWAHKIQEVES